MSLRNFVPSYPQLSVNPPPHHQAHRVQALPVSVATALQQQISQQQQQQQQQSQGSAQNNNGGAGNVQQQQTHEYHVTHLPFQAPNAANIQPNFIRHMSSKILFWRESLLVVILLFLSSRLVIFKLANVLLTIIFIFQI
jgi:hypothetical protein